MRVNDYQGKFSSKTLAVKFLIQENEQRTHGQTFSFSSS